MDLSSHGIVALISSIDGKFLLLEDSRELMKGLWAPPHGRCEKTDTSEEAGVIREVKEETSLVVEPIRKLLTQQADTKVKTVSFWLVKVIGSTTVTLNEESSQSGWFTIKEALGMPLYPGTKIFFEKMLMGEVDIS